MIFKNLFTDKCPACKEPLTVNRTGSFTNRIVKFCPNGHYEKESHPALETCIETFKN